MPFALLTQLAQAGGRRVVVGVIIKLGPAVHACNRVGVCMRSGCGNRRSARAYCSLLMPLTCERMPPQPA